MHITKDKLKLSISQEALDLMEKQNDTVNIDIRNGALHIGLQGSLKVDTDMTQLLRQAIAKAGEDTVIDLLLQIGNTISGKSENTTVSNIPTREALMDISEGDNLTMDIEEWEKIVDDM